MLVIMSDRPVAQPGALAALTDPVDRPPAPPGDDGLLVAQAKAGDRAAFDALITIHQQRIARLVQRLLGWSGEIDDVVQDVFVDALKNLRRFDGRSSVLTWLTRIAINRCRTHQRKQWLWKKWFQRNSSSFQIGNSSGATGFASAATNLFRQETIHQVHGAIGQLTQQAREVIVLRYLEELSIDEIACMLNLSRGTVDVRLTRARQQLEKILKPHFEP